MKLFYAAVTLLFLFAFQRTVEATSLYIRGELCPTNCSCSAEGSKLAVDCLGRSSVHSEQLSHQLDTLLSSNLTLTALNITNSPLTHIPRSVCRLKTLTHLHLDHNRLTRLPDNCFANVTSLVSLTASRNYITELQDGVFDGLSRLERLVLSDNRISSIGLRVFNGSSMLTSLREVALSRNKIRTVEPWFYYVAINGLANHRASVDLGYNNISNFTNMMGWKAERIRSTVQFILILDRNPIKHMSDILHGWNMTLLTVWLLSSFIPGLELSLKGVHVDCDCVDFDILKPAKLPLIHFHFLSNVYCNKPAALYHREVATVHLEQLVCELSELCPPGCRCLHRPANASLHILCSNASMTVLPLELPELPKSFTKYKLDFSNNRLLRRLEQRNYFVNTSILDVSNCNLDSVDFQLWNALTSIERVHLDGNQLKSLPSLIARTSLERTKLSLSRNPWKCFCDSSWMSGWLKSARDSIANPDSIVCYSPRRLENRNIINISEEEFCKDPASEAVKRTLTISMSTVGGAVLVLFSAGVIVYRLRVKLYTRWKFHPFDRDTCHGEDMHYDLFLSCSSNDNLPHGNRIRQEVERHGYRVCYPPRDFLAGGTIHDNIYNAVVHSKRVVCLLTANFLQRCVFGH